MHGTRCRQVEQFSALMQHDRAKQLWPLQGTSAAMQSAKHQRGVQPLHATPGDRAEAQTAFVTWTFSIAWMLPAVHCNVITLPAWWQWLAMQASRCLVKLGTFQGTCCLQRLQLDSQTSIVPWPTQPAFHHPVCQIGHCCCHTVCGWSEAAGKITRHSQVWISLPSAAYKGGVMQL